MLLIILFTYPDAENGLLLLVLVRKNTILKLTVLVLTVGILFSILIDGMPKLIPKKISQKPLLFGSIPNQIGEQNIVIGEQRLVMHAFYLPFSKEECRVEKSFSLWICVYGWRSNDCGNIGALSSYSFYGCLAFLNEIVEFEKIGAVFNAGRLKAGYVDRGSTSDFILIPGPESIVATVSPKCPRDMIMQVVSEEE